MTYLRSHLPQGSSTPEVERSEGIRPAQHFAVASYLPGARYDGKVGAWKVISTGKVLARDNNNYIVPAGLAIDLKTAVAGAYADKNAFITATASFGNVYTTSDVTEGVLNSAGDAVVANEPVVASFFTTYDASAAKLNDVSSPIGLASYDAWRQNGAGYGDDNDAGNSADYTYTNFSLQQGIAAVTRYFIELPVVANTSGLALPGMTVFEGDPSTSTLVTFNKNSNFVPFAGISQVALSTTNTYTDAALNTAINAVVDETNDALNSVLGKVLFIDAKFPKGFLEYVKTPVDNLSLSGATALDKVTGASTSGLPMNLSYAGVTDPATAKVVRINVII